jgi:hypothetical protein
MEDATGETFLNSWTDPFTLKISVKHNKGIGSSLGLLAGKRYYG